MTRLMVQKEGRGNRGMPPFQMADFVLRDTISPPSSGRSAGSATALITMSAAGFSSELASALKENSFGLKDYKIVQETQLESIATVVLLEGDTATVSLSPRGFQVGSLIGCVALPFFFFSFRISPHDQRNQVLDKGTEIICETLEQLLITLSPAFRLASQQALFSRLEEFAAEHVDRGAPSY